MTAPATPDRVTVDVHLPPGGPLSGMAADVRAGLTKPFKELSPRYFYDERGSELFEQITELDEYYPTRCEREILAGPLRRRSSPRRKPRALIELGSGSAAKTRVLLDAMDEAGCLDGLLPRSTSPRRSPARPPTRSPPSTRASRCCGHVCDFELDLERIPVDGPRVTAFLGRHDRQLPAGPARQLPAPGRQPARPRGPLPARHRPGQGPRPPSSSPTTTRRASPRRST